MNYQKIHDQIILRSKLRPIPDCYCEKHHIVPRSMGGTDDSLNISVLKAREHFIIHWLLKKIYGNKEMIYAFHAMTKPVGNGRKRYTSKSFKYARESMSKYMSENRSGENHPLYGIKGTSNPNYGSKRSIDSRAKMSKKAIERTGIKNPNSRKIICVDTGEVFNSISCAKKAFPKGNINNAIKTGGKANGLRFCYDGEDHECKLKGYAKGGKHRLSIPVVDSFGKFYESASEAARELGVSREAIYAAIRDNRPCKNKVFYHA